MLLTTGLRALQIGLALGCLAMLFSGVSAALSGTPPDPFELPAAAPAEANAIPLERLTVIEKRDLFGTQGPAGAEEAMLEEDLPPSKAEWRLIGTVAMSDPSLAIATLEHKQRRELRGVWRANEDIEPGLSLVRIEPRRVVVRHDGRHEQIPMDEETGGPPVAAPPARGPNASERRDSARQERVDHLAEQREQQRLEELRVQAEAAAAAQAAQAAEAPLPGQARLETLMSSLRMTPVQDENGELTDVIVEPNLDVADNPFGDVQPGTRCHKLNKIPVSRLHEAIATMSDDQQACLECTLPDGTARTFCF